MSDLGGLQSDLGVDREKLILDHVPLLKHIAGRMSLDMSKSIDREDLCGYGMIGLVQAADAWEPGRGLAFSTFAYPRIRGAILDELRRRDFLPRGRREKVRELERAMRELEQASGAIPSPEELADVLGASLDEIDAILLSAKSAGETSLDDAVSVDLSQRLSDPKARDPVGSAEWLEMKELLEQAIRELNQAEQTVITLYYGEELLLKEISLVLDVTESRVSQIHTRALYRLNAKLTRQLGSQAP